MDSFAKYAAYADAAAYDAAYTAGSSFHSDDAAGPHAPSMVNGSQASSSSVDQQSTVSEISSTSSDAVESSTSSKTGKFSNSSSQPVTTVFDMKCSVAKVLRWPYVISVPVHRMQPIRCLYSAQLFLKRRRKLSSRAALSDENSKKIIIIIKMIKIYVLGSLVLYVMKTDVVLLITLPLLLPLF